MQSNLKSPRNWCFWRKMRGFFSSKGVNHVIKARKDVDFRLYRAFGVKKFSKLVFWRKMRDLSVRKGLIMG